MTVVTAVTVVTVVTQVTVFTTIYLYDKIYWDKKKIWDKKQLERKSVVREKNCDKKFGIFFAFQVFCMKKVCYEIFYDGTKKCDNRLVHAKVFFMKYIYAAKYVFVNSFVR